MPNQVTIESVRAYLLKTFPDNYKQYPDLLGPDADMLYSVLKEIQETENEP